MFYIVRILFTKARIKFYISRIRFCIVRIRFYITRIRFYIARIKFYKARNRFYKGEICFTMLEHGLKNFFGFWLLTKRQLSRLLFGLVGIAAAFFPESEDRAESGTRSGRSETDLFQKKSPQIMRRLIVFKTLFSLRILQNIREHQRRTNGRVTFNDKLRCSDV